MGSLDLRYNSTRTRMSRLVMPSMILLFDNGNVQKVARVMDATTKAKRV